MYRKTGTCGRRRKKRFPDEYVADRALRSIQQLVVPGGYAPVRWYWHSECHGFHLTSQPLRELAA